LNVPDSFTMMRSPFRKARPRKGSSTIVQQQPAAEEPQQKKIRPRKPKGDEKRACNGKKTSNRRRRKKRHGSSKKNEDHQTDVDSVGWRCQSEVDSVGWKLDRKTIRERNMVPTMLDDFMSRLASENEPPLVLVECRSAAYHEDRRRLLAMSMGCPPRAINHVAPVLREWTYEDGHFKTKGDTDISKSAFATTTKRHSTIPFNAWTLGLLVKPPSFEEQTTVNEMRWDSKSNFDDSKEIEFITDDWDPFDLESVDLSPHSILSSNSVDSAVIMKPVRTPTSKRWPCMEWPRR
jgi:hypothetical protein